MKRLFLALHIWRLERTISEWDNAYIGANTGTRQVINKEQTERRELLAELKGKL